MLQETTFLSGKTKEPAIPDVMNNRGTAEYNRGGLALLSFFYWDLRPLRFSYLNK